MAHMGKVSHIGNNGKSVTCLNCGEMCRGNYCSHCGQATSTSRLQTRSFMLDTLSGLLRVNRGFFFTAWNLLIHPWDVIRDYAAGRRVRYLAPVAMLLVLCLISVVADSLTPSSDSLSLMLDDRMDRASTRGVYWFYAALKYVWTSPVLQNLLFFIPGVILVPVIFRKYGGGRYNAAEYLMAAIYMVDAFLAFDIVVFPLSLLSLGGLETWASWLYALSVTIISLSRAFRPRGGGWLFAVTLSAYVAAVLVLYFIIFVVAVLLFSHTL